MIPIASLLLVGSLAFGAARAPGGRAPAVAAVGSPISIVVSGRSVAGDDVGTFTLTGVGSNTGRSVTSANISHATRVMRQQAFEGTSPGNVRLEGRPNNLFVVTSGRYVAVTLSGITTVVTTGTWRISGGTGAYKRWRGGGRFVSVSRGLRRSSGGEEAPDNGRTFVARYEGVILV